MSVLYNMNIVPSVLMHAQIFFVEVECAGHDMTTFKWPLKAPGRYYKVCPIRHPISLIETIFHTKLMILSDSHAYSRVIATKKALFPSSAYSTWSLRW